MLINDPVILGYKCISLPVFSTYIIMLAGGTVHCCFEGLRWMFFLGQMASTAGFIFIKIVFLSDLIHALQD